MSFEAAFLGLMPHTITTKAFLRRSTDGYGSPIYASTSASIRGRVVTAPVLLRRPDGQEVTATHTMWLHTTRSFTLNDQVTFDGSTYRLVEAARYPDQDGVHHTRLRLVA